MLFLYLKYPSVITSMHTHNTELLLMYLFTINDSLGHFQKTYCQINQNH